MTTWIDFQGAGFTLRVPSDWVITATSTIQAMFLAPERGQLLRANLAVVLAPVEPNVTPRGVAEAARATQERDYPSFALISDQTIQQSGLEGVHHLYSWYNAEVDTPVTQSQTYFVHNQVLITLTATTSRDEEEFNAPIFTEMLASFKVTVPAA